MHARSCIVWTRSASVPGRRRCAVKPGSLNLFDSVGEQAPVPVRSSGRLQDRNLCVLEGNDGAGMQPHTCPER